jgi:hypothetical protein
MTELEETATSSIVETASSSECSSDNSSTIDKMDCCDDGMNNNETTVSHEISTPDASSLSKEVPVDLPDVSDVKIINENPNNIVSDSSEGEEDHCEDKTKVVSPGTQVVEETTLAECESVQHNATSTGDDKEETDSTERDQDVGLVKVSSSTDKEDRHWELKKVMTHAELTARGRPKLCSTEKCSLRAAFIYENMNDVDQRLTLCLDCNVSQCSLFQVIQILGFFLFVCFLCFSNIEHQKLI